MESLYERFNTYDFDNDARFQDGVKKIKTPDSDKNLLKLKLFYYNKFVEPIDLASLEQWKDEQHYDQDVSGIKRDTVGGVKSEAPLSFSEVLRLIQAGDEIPGIHKLDITPFEQQPTASQMPRRTKPWEK